MEYNNITFITNNDVVVAGGLSLQTRGFSESEHQAQPDYPGQSTDSAGLPLLGTDGLAKLPARRNRKTSEC